MIGTLGMIIVESTINTVILNSSINPFLHLDMRFPFLIFSLSPFFSASNWISGDKNETETETRMRFGRFLQTVFAQLCFASKQLDSDKTTSGLE